MRHYPAFLDLRGRRCLVAGLGGVGRRKLAGLLECDPAEVLAVDPRRPDDAEGVLAHPAVRYSAHPVRAEDVAGRFLVFAATADAAENQRIASLCAEHGALCNVADAPESCDFMAPALLRRGDATLALSTGGASPALARRLRRDLERFLDKELAGLAPLAELLKRLRPMALGLGRETPANTELFRRLVDPPEAEALLAALAARDARAARDALLQALPRELHPNIDELLHELV